MKLLRFTILTVITFSLLFGVILPKSNAFIAREYTLQEVLDVCTNVVFGKVVSVDRQNMRAIVRVEEDVKGKTDFKQIKINIAVGQGNFPQRMTKKFKPGLPIIVFYAKEGMSINALGHVANTWFQIVATDGPDKNKVWWNFTHIEIYMHRTYNGSTADFQKILCDAVAGKNWPGASADTVKVLVLAGNGVKPTVGQVPTKTSATHEFFALNNIDKIGERKVAYHLTKDRALPGLDEANILWLGQGEIVKGKYLFNEETEEKIKNFVKRGGIVITAGQYINANPPGDFNWIPEPISGVTRPPHGDFHPARVAADLFKTPNVIKTGRLYLADTWTDSHNKYEILATSNVGKEIAIAMLKYGKGIYFITGLRNDSQMAVKINEPMMANLIHFAVKQLDKGSKTKSSKG